MELLDIYGFCVPKTENPCANYKFRLILGASTESAIEEVDELFPTQKILDDYENFNLTTEQIAIQSYHLSSQFLQYLRSVL